jgi:hypothetical protein
MEREDDYRWTATSCLTVDARYLAFTGQTQFRKRRTAVGLRDVCQQCGRDLVRAICDWVGPVRADISTDDRCRATDGPEWVRHPGRSGFIISSTLPPQIRQMCRPRGEGVRV